MANEIQKAGMQITWCGIAKAAALGFGTYVVGQYILFRSLDAKGYFEVESYLHGLVRGSGDSTTATQNLNNWYNYWLTHKGFFPQFLLDNLYDHGIWAIEEMYS